MLLVQASATLLPCPVLNETEVSVLPTSSIAKPHAVHTGQGLHVPLVILSGGDRAGAREKGVEVGDGSSITSGSSAAALAVRWCAWLGIAELIVKVKVESLSLPKTPSAFRAKDLRLLPWGLIGRRIRLFGSVTEVQGWAFFRQCGWGHLPAQRRYTGEV